MIFCGLYCSRWNVDITALSGEYQYLDSKKFSHDACRKIPQWINSLKVLKNERCAFFFNNDAEHNIFQRFMARFLISQIDEVYYIPYRRINGILLFFLQFCQDNSLQGQVDFNQSFILASGLRLFDLNEINSYRYIYSNENQKRIFENFKS